MHPLSTLLFLLPLVSAVPTPEYPRNCHSASCPTTESRPSPPRGGRPSRAMISGLSWQPPATIPGTKTEPHFPGHQLSSPSSSTTNEEDIVIDNAPTHPGKEIPASEALSAEWPLESTYLLSLSKSNPAIAKLSQPASSDSSEAKIELDAALPAKPSSALSETSKEYSERYWASRPRPVKDVYKKVRFVSYTTVVRGAYADLIVVGIVVLFLVIVVGLEALEKLRSLRSSSTGNWNDSRPGRSGAIFLADDETLAYVIPKPQYQIPELIHEKRRGSEFEYDIDADVV